VTIVFWSVYRAVRKPFLVTGDVTRLKSAIIDLERDHILWDSEGMNS
jgi:hypothetical protein